MREARGNRLKILRWVGWSSALVAAAAAVIVMSYDPGALSGWGTAGAVLLFGATAALLCRLTAALIVARQRAEMHARALRESETRTRTIVDTAADAIITIDEQGMIQSFNAVAERIFGYAADEVTGRNVNLLMPSPHSEQHDEYIARHIRSGEAKGIGTAREREGKRKDGTIIPIETAVSEVRLPGRRLFAGIIRDISERKRAEEALRESRRFLQSVIDRIPDPLLVLDREYHVVLANQAAREMAGGEAPVSGHLTCYGISHHRDRPCDADEHPCPLGDVVAAKAPVTVTHTHFGADGKEAIVEINASPIFDQTGEVVQIIELCRNITARVRAEDRARQRQAELAHVARLGTMGEMAAGLAHELSQPLAAIVNYIQACLERIRAGVGDSDELLADMAQAAAQAERAGDVIDHVRDFVRKREPRQTPVNLNTLVQEAAELVKLEVRQNGVNVQLDLANALPMASAQVIQIKQVVVNLMRNSLEAMSEDGSDTRRLTIRTSRVAGDLVEFTIQDTGPGVASEISDRVFDPFFTTKSNGMGMGLSICRTIVEAHGGRLGVIPNPQGGAAFRFVLPINGGDLSDGS